MTDMERVKSDGGEIASKWQTGTSAKFRISVAILQGSELHAGSFLASPAPGYGTGFPGKQRGIVHTLTQRALHTDTLVHIPLFFACSREPAAGHEDSDETK